MTTPECHRTEPHEPHTYGAGWCYGNPAHQKCAAVGDLVVNGKKVGYVRCDLPFGHERNDAYLVNAGIIPSVKPHRATLEWSDDAAMLADWPEAYDPDEGFDVELEDPDEVSALNEPHDNADIETGSATHSRPGSRCESRRPDGSRCIAMRGHDFMHVSAGGERWE